MAENAHNQGPEVPVIGQRRTHEQRQQQATVDPWELEINLAGKQDYYDYLDEM